MALFGRGRRVVTCFYCLTRSLLLPPQPPARNAGPKPPRDQLEGSGATAVGTEQDFWCSICGCWNRKDVNGNLIDFLPEMADPAANADAFNKRASQPTTFSGASPERPGRASPHFCRTCETNQSLQLNLLANYLPAEDEVDPKVYEELIINLPAYRASLDQRYPLVCPSCEPGVSATLAARDYRARVTALGSIIGGRNSPAASPRRRRKAGTSTRYQGWRWRAAELVWLARGFLWAATQLAGILLSAVCATRPDLLPQVPTSRLPHLAFFSILWAFWDPMWARARRRMAQGRRVTIVGRPQLLLCNALSFLFRFALAVGLCQGLSLADLPPHTFALLAILLSVLALAALMAIRLRMPSVIHLAPLKSPPSGTGPPPSEDSLFADLSITPTLTPSRSPAPNTRDRHVSPFGNPAPFSPSDPPPADHIRAEDDTMDWAPTPPRLPPLRELPPQRFVPPASGSGTDLEGLFGGVTMNDKTQERPGPKKRRGWLRRIGEALLTLEEEQ